MTERPLRPPMRHRDRTASRAAPEPGAGVRPARPPRPRPVTARVADPAGNPPVGSADRYPGSPPHRRGCRERTCRATGSRNRCTTKADPAAAPGRRSVRRATVSIASRVRAILAVGSTARGQVVEHRANLLQRQADPLRGPNERDPSNHVTGVAPLVARRSQRLDQRLFLVEAKRRRGEPRAAGDVADGEAEFPAWCFHGVDFEFT